jgi:hypothetical protein
MAHHPPTIRRRIYAAIAAGATVFGLGVIATAPASAHTGAAASGAGAAGGGTVIYVSPNGNDGNSGTSPARPLRTVTAAQSLVRSLDADMHADITVELESGTYRLSAPLTLGAADSGTNGYDVVWTAAPGAHPVLSGGTQITGWHESDPSKDIWSAPVPAGLDTRQLYVNGVRAQPASGPAPVTLTPTSTGYTASSDVMASWSNPSEIDFVYTGSAAYWSLKSGGEGGWTEPQCPVASISGTTITMAEPCWDNSTLRAVNHVGDQDLANGEQPSYIENAYPLLTQPGQWYLDESANTLYYIPRHGENLATADVEAPVLQSLVTGQGTETAPVHDLVFSGIQFSYATWLQPSSPEGFSEIQANYTLTGDGAGATQGLCGLVPGGTCPFGDWTQEPGNVSFSYDRDVSFLGDAFVHLGAAGLLLGDGSQNDTVQGDVFTDISGNGLELGGVDDPEPSSAAQDTTGNRITDDHLYDLPVEYHGGVAVDVGYAEHTLISHNQINDTAYTGISLGWGGWLDKIGQPAIPNYSNDNVVSDNLLYDTMQMLADGGDIYTQGITGSSLADGEQITGNVALDTLDQNHAFYTDNGSTFITITDNVAFGNWTDWGSRHTDYTAGATGDDPLTISDNYWQQGDPDNVDKNVTESDNHIIASLDQAPAKLLASAGLEPGYRSILTEAFSPGSAPIAPTQIAGYAGNGLAYVGWNPSFVDNGSPVTAYTVTASPGGASTTVSAAAYRQFGHAVVKGLTNGVGYTFTVTATNAHGTGEASLPTSTITPSTAAVSVPGAPTSVSVDTDATNDTVSVHWDPPSSDGGAPITAYTISAPGTGMKPVTVTGHTTDWAGSTRAIYATIGGLKPLSAYDFEVTADNSAGASTPGSAGTTVIAPTTACTGATLTENPPSALVEPGSTVTVTATLADGCADALDQARLYLFAPSGYQVAPGSAQSGGTVVAPGSSTSESWTVTVPADATSGAGLLTQAVFTEDGQSEGLQSASTVSVPAASLSAAFDNVGITDDTNPTVGDIDGAGSSFSAQALAALGATPGASITVGGVSFTWPDVAAGEPDNVVADGGAFALSGTGSTLSFLLTASYGPGGGTGQVVYTDGSTSSYTLSAPDWHGGCTTPPSAATVLQMSYRNRATGQNQLSVCVYDASVPLTAGKTVAMVILPDVSSGVASGTAALHVFAATIS